mgnify:CR=1 FL=1
MTKKNAAAMNAAMPPIEMRNVRQARSSDEYSFAIARFVSYWFRVLM